MRTVGRGARSLIEAPAGTENGANPRHRIMAHGAAPNGSAREERGVSRTGERSIRSPISECARLKSGKPRVAGKMEREACSPVRVAM